MRLCHFIVFGLTRPGLEATIYHTQGELTITPLIWFHSDYSGSSVSSAGDVNGDGLDDLIVGAYFADPSHKSSAGKSRVVCISNHT
jgi:hypothetical protein